MATKDTEGGGFMDVSRREFLKFSATAAAVGGVAGFTFDAAKALAYENNANGLGTNAYKITATTCPYCSASCGQRVVTNASGTQILDVYGDFESPHNSGGLCAKGAGTYQLVTNPGRHRRVSTQPTNPGFAAKTGALEQRAPISPYRWLARTHQLIRLNDDLHAPASRTSARATRMPTSVYRWLHCGIAAKGLTTARGTLRTSDVQQQERGVLRQFAHEQRAELHLSQDHRELRYVDGRASGANMTLVHGRRSGGRIRTRRDDQQLDGHRELHAHHRVGCQSG